MSPTAAVAGFITAQDELREEFGSPGVFRIPTSPTWPGGTKINPDTGLPYDSTAVRTNAAYTTVTITVLVILKQGSPLRPQADTHFDPVGEQSGMDIILDAGVTDYASVEQATEFDIAGRSYKVEEVKPFELGGSLYRYLIYGMEK